MEDRNDSVIYPSNLLLQDIHEVLNSFNDNVKGVSISNKVETLKSLIDQLVIEVKQEAANDN